ncbi:MAG: phosphoribosylglycinamide formyltransferase [Bacillota bacterium]|uniref:Phosphoribosylglycinamide formyltransferase n=1 Tax=Thermanaerosceptrum fracticalcis TaxID=1712410 RepID=A0A7G6E360_THEFR|nr:phosphoribosylglycinamide formyltransferase [Thermanaerosceptrum fracticalcis]QNB46514.1 phosphoribosylglycinamide formyltransferase [Thermanaerosceptrum fracticalcis]
MAHLRLAVLASGRGSNLQALLDASERGQMNASVVVVISDKEKAQALERARKHGIPALWVNPRDFSGKENFEAAVLEVIKTYKVDYILLAGFMRILSPSFIRQAGIPILNIHPSLLPAFPGLNAQKQAIDYGVRYSGCTVHFVDEGVDSGPIILQAVVPVFPDDSEETLSMRILREEHKLYPLAVRLLSEGRVRCVGRKVIISGEGEVDG